MTPTDKKQFGIWMDNYNATIVARVGDGSEFGIIAKVTNPGPSAHSDERKFFKEILSHMQNAEQVHITGTGTAQEQLINFMKDIPQYKDTATQASTTTPISDERLIEYISAKF